jgi:hypothetical protein
MTAVDIINALFSFAIGAVSTSVFYEGYHHEKMRVKENEIMRLKEENFRLNQKIISR